MNKGEVVKRKEVDVHEVPVAPESMNVLVSMVLLFPCSEMGKLIVLLLGDATSTQLIRWEEDIEATSLFKNPMLQEWRSWRSLQWVLHNR